MNHILAVCDAEEAYASSLVNYINQKEGFPFRAQYFSTPEKLNNFSKEQKTEVVLASELFFKELKAEVVIYIAVQRLKPHHLCALIERMLRRTKDLCHKMKFATRENEVYMLSKLYVRA